MIARFERPRGAARVAARRDDRALLERGAVGHREPDRDLGRDVDVGEPAHAAAAEQRARAAALPHDRRVDDRAGLDGLERVDLHARVDDRVLADEALVADHDAFLDVGVARGGRSARPMTAAAQTRRRCPTYTWSCTTVRSMNASAFTTTSVPSTVYGASSRAGLDAGVVADEHRALDEGVRVERRRPRRATRRRAAGSPVDVDLHPLVEDVLVRGAVRLERADVLPVAVDDVPEERQPAGRAPRGTRRSEKSTTSSGGDEVEDPGLEHVDAGVDRVGEHLAPRRLLEEALDRCRRGG